jgi:hypothetical protein
MVAKIVIPLLFRLVKMTEYVSFLIGQSPRNATLRRGMT